MPAQNERGFSMNNSLLIENGTVLVTGKKPAVLTGHSILIENGLISRIGAKNRMPRFIGQRIDASGKVVMAGFINAHTHLYSAFALGLTNFKPAKDFNQVLKHLWWRLDSALTTKDCYYSALVALLASVRHGTTTLIDHHASPNAVSGALQAVAQAVRETGLRACLCYEVSDRNGLAIAVEGLRENAAFIRETQRAPGGGEAVKDGGPQMPPPQLAALFGLHASFTLRNSTLERAAALGHELGAGFHIHVAEAESDQQDAWQRHGLRVVERLENHGVLGAKTIAAHCVHVNAKEVQVLAETGTAVVHNPQSNMNNAVGVADIVGMNKRGVLVGLGTDAMTSNMLEEQRSAVWAQHLAAKNPSTGFPEAINALFLNNPAIATRIFGVPVGELREGAAGDVVLLDYDPPTPLTTENLYGHVLFGLSQAVVDTTIVGGRVLMKNRRLTLNLDENRINARAREQAKNLWKKL
jgi:putative selenium metabolism protein SsnA